MQKSIKSAQGSQGCISYWINVFSPGVLCSIIYHETFTCAMNVMQLHWNRTLTPILKPEQTTASSNELLSPMQLSHDLKTHNALHLPKPMFNF